MGIGVTLLSILVLMMFSAIPRWPYSKSWGYLPSVGLGCVIVFIVAVFLVRRL